MPKKSRAAKVRRKRAKPVRVTGDQRFYNSLRWRTVSKRHKQEYPLCAACEALGEVVGVQVTDHAIPINEGGARMDTRNYLSLCHPCHNRKRGLEAHGFARRVQTMQGYAGLIPVSMDEVVRVLVGPGGGS